MELKLRPVLRHLQIYMISISAVIGIGILHGDTSALEVAGPGGVICALCIVAVVAICVMECISGFVQLWPVPNTLMVYVRCFVDDDLALVAGAAYWSLV